MSTLDEIAARDATKHRHDWKRADDWDWGPGTVTFECVGCRGLRVVRRRLTEGSDRT